MFRYSFKIVNLGKIGKCYYDKANSIQYLRNTEYVSVTIGGRYKLIHGLSF